MRHKVLSVTFETNAQPSTEGRFTIPKTICEFLGLESEDAIQLLIQTPEGKTLYDGEKTLKSGTEIYGDDIRDRVRSGQRILVTVSYPRE